MSINDLLVVVDLGPLQNVRFKVFGCRATIGFKFCH